MTPDEAMDDCEMPEATTTGQRRAASREEIRRLIDETGNASLIEGSTWYLVSNKWWNKLVHAASQGYVDDVGEIDSSDISESNRKNQFFLKSNLGDGADFQTLPETVFRRLRDIYGLDNDSRDYIPREVVRKNNQLIVEVYPRIVHVALARNRNLRVDVTLKPDDDMGHLRDRVMTELNITNGVQVRFYVVNGESFELVDTTQSLDSYFDTAQNVVVDTFEDGKWFCESKASTPPPSTKENKSVFGSQKNNDEDSDDEEKLMIMYTSARANGPFSYVWRQMRFYWSHLTIMFPRVFRHLFGWIVGWWLFDFSQRSIGNGSYGYSSQGSEGNVPRGMCGLTNLGNTCFMASALQCISNIPQLRDFFLGDSYLRDINESNPLGTGGKLAKSLGDLLKNMWSGKYNSMVPRNVKSVISTFQPRFSGYMQHDAHELIAYVLDGLHEDLNRIKNKPYIPDNDELAKLPDAEQAHQSWLLYKKRNDSVVVDYLHGQLKSTLVCPVCAKISVKFDPFCCLSLPLPPKETSSRQNVTLVFRDRKWAKFTIVITRQTTIADVEQVMRTKLAHAHNFHLIFYSITKTQAQAPLVNDDILLLRPDDLLMEQSSVAGRDKEIYAFEVDDDINHYNTRIVVAYNRTKLGRVCSLPIILTLSNEREFNRGMLVDRVLPITRKLFFVKPDAVVEDDDESMNGNCDDKEPFKLFVTENSAFLPIPPTGNDFLGWPAVSHNDPFTGVQRVVFQWKDKEYFNNYRGADLVEREATVKLRQNVHLLETLDWFTKREQLGEDDLWYCPNCKKHERATKKLDIWKLPEVLILHLKRFQYNRWTREKLAWNVDIPVKGFDLTKSVANQQHEPAVYDLIGMCMHFGTLNGGHYTAQVYNDHIKQWVNFNDAFSEPFNGPPDHYVSGDPYFLVYQRRPLDRTGRPVEIGMTAMFDRSKLVMPSEVDENVEVEMDD